MSEKCSERRKCVVLGVTGGIAVYKAADLCSRLRQRGYEVIVVMTPNARKLISDQIFFTLSGNPVLLDLFDAPVWKPCHVALSEKADLLLVAPCTANFLGKFAHGIADDALSTVALTHRGKVLLAPAMNTAMWEAPVVRANVDELRRRGVCFAGPAIGHLACGTSGEGRMSNVGDVLSAVDEILGG